MMDNHYPREEALVLHLVERLKLDLAKPPWNPNSSRFQSGADVTLLLSDGRLIGVQVNEIDPFARAGARGREKAQVRASASGVVGNYVQNDSVIALDSISRAIKRKACIRSSKTQFNEFWLLLCAGVPDAPTSTFIPTAPLVASDLDTATRSLLLHSQYSECFLLPFLSIERAIYRWSKKETGNWRKHVLLEEITLGAGDAEYVRELLRTGGKDRSVVHKRVREILDEVRGNLSSSGAGAGRVGGATLDEIRAHYPRIAGTDNSTGRGSGSYA
jgi:hypothetical protein